MCDLKCLLPPKMVTGISPRSTPPLSRIVIGRVGGDGGRLGGGGPMKGNAGG